MDVASLLHATQSSLTSVFANNPRELQIVNQQFNSMLLSIRAPVVSIARAGFLQVVQTQPGTGDYRTSTSTVNPQTQMVLGIISNMLESFEARLAEVETKRVNDKTEFAGLKDTKKTTLSTMQESLKTKQAQLAFAMTNGADAKEQLADVRNVLSADRVFLGVGDEEIAGIEWDDPLCFPMACRFCVTHHTARCDLTGDIKRQRCRDR